MKEATVDAILEMTNDTTLESLVMAGMRGDIVTTLYARVDDETREVLEVFENCEASSSTCLQSSVEGETLRQLYQTGGGCDSIMDGCTEIDNAEGIRGSGKYYECSDCDGCELFIDSKRAVEDMIAEEIVGLRVEE